KSGGRFALLGRLPGAALAVAWTNGDSPSPACGASRGIGGSRELRPALGLVREGSGESNEEALAKGQAESWGTGIRGDRSRMSPHFPGGIRLQGQLAALREEEAVEGRQGEFSAVHRAGLDGQAAVAGKLLAAIGIRRLWGGAAGMRLRLRSRAGQQSTTATAERACDEKRKQDCKSAVEETHAGLQVRLP